VTWWTANRTTVVRNRSIGCPGASRIEVVDVAFGIAALAAVPLARKWSLPVSLTNGVGTVLLAAAIFSAINAFIRS
jgi:hypothetical protein